MNSSTASFRRAISILFLMALILPLPASAGKRRAVRTHTRLPEVNGSVKGKVTDAVTGLPVINAKVSAGRSDTTNSAGEYEIKSASGYGSIEVTVTRTGYQEYRTTLPAGDHQLNIQMQPTATATIRTTGGQLYTVDYDSIKFRTSSGFSGTESTFEDFCAPDGTKIRHSRDEMQRITGPATYANVPSCCSTLPTLKVTIQLKGQAPAEFQFADSCSTGNPMSIASRQHVSGELLYVPFTEILEVVFP